MSAEPSPDHHVPPSTRAPDTRADEDGGLFGWARRGWFGVVDLVFRHAVEEAAPDRILSYREVVGYFTTDPPPDAVRGVLLREQRVGAWSFTMAFVGPDHQPLTDRATGHVAGKVVLARDCDAELRELFGERDLIIFD